MPRHDIEIRQTNVTIILDHLISRCRWNSNRLQRAAHDARNPELYQFLRETSQERSRFSNELVRFTSRVEEFGEQTEPNDVPRLRLEGPKDEILAEECLQREDDMLRVYGTRFKNRFPNACNH